MEQDPANENKRSCSSLSRLYLSLGAPQILSQLLLTWGGPNSSSLMSAMWQVVLNKKKKKLKTKKEKNMIVPRYGGGKSLL